MRYVLCLLAVAALCCCTACTMTSAAKDYSGLSIPEGAPKAHVNTTNIAIHVLFSTPVVGDATLPTVVKDCTAAARDEGATRIRLVQSGVTTYWWILPPFSFVIHPLWRMRLETLTDDFAYGWFSIKCLNTAANNKANLRKPVSLPSALSRYAGQACGRGVASGRCGAPALTAPA